MAKQVMPGAHQGLAVQTDGVAIGPESVETWYEGNQQYQETVTNLVPRLNFSDKFALRVAPDGTVTIDLA